MMILERLPGGATAIVIVILIAIELGIVPGTELEPELAHVDSCLVDEIASIVTVSTRMEAILLMVVEYLT